MSVEATDRPGQERATWLEGHLAPIEDEVDATCLKITGALPPELTGRYFRNGPNPLPGRPSGHWFTGPGMIHGVRLRDGRAEWYRNRWVRTRSFTDPDARYAAADGTLDLTAVAANTHVVPHGDRILALVENGLPYEVTPELGTAGPCDFGGTLTTAMTAHPKQDPVTGDLLFFGYGVLPPYLTYHRLPAGGSRIVESAEIAVPGPTMMHDFAITENHVVWLDLPVVFDLETALGGAGMPFRWDESYGARLGVMRRDAAGDVRWFDIDPCYVFHVGNAHEDAAGRIVLDGVRYRSAEFAGLWTRIGGAASPSHAAAQSGTSSLYRWTLDPASGRVSEESLDDRNVEFPTHDDARTGREHRFLYTVAGNAVVKYDLRDGSSSVREFEEGASVGEAVFVPAEGARGEDEGWLLSIVSGSSGAELAVLDAADLSRTAGVRLPRRVPAGFHGSWIPDA
ncbi:carotenoid oxygenase family protein [Actinomadura violacea]|uniref:Dioxygenase n=1 Tax=Actinomadura violacea TaxID=2819934 RepID=A0ABS3RIF2_9ACTN|nr:carotenoid oxygenase family protein [Actinomadura violacea]MBO2456506.1 carotenoid oxygenase family protein [Actinomadura violacea]